MPVFLDPVMLTQLCRITGRLAEDEGGASEDTDHAIAHQCLRAFQGVAECGRLDTDGRAALGTGLRDLELAAHHFSGDDEELLMALLRLYRPPQPPPMQDVHTAAATTTTTTSAKDKLLSFFGKDDRDDEFGANTSSNSFGGIFRKRG